MIMMANAEVVTLYYEAIRAVQGQRERVEAPCYTRTILELLVNSTSDKKLNAHSKKHIL
jgi:hypothetical protein